jgi:hypothetical protein
MNSNKREINNIIETRMIFNMCILDMRILNSDYGIDYKPSLTKLINHVDIEMSELNYTNKNYNTHFYNKCDIQNLSNPVNDLSGFCKLEMIMILKSYPKDHFIHTWLDSI